MQNEDAPFAEGAKTQWDVELNALYPNEGDFQRVCFAAKSRLLAFMHANEDMLEHVAKRVDKAAPVVALTAYVMKNGEASTVDAMSSGALDSMSAFLSTVANELQNESAALQA